ncbi:MAG: GvpL/GvpF family gas vesicle protein [Deltaproteobacteria bacterium]|nr:GvpL/GvpF family gas vesicle protein [Deltaproteobacteria bacterium]
MGLHGDPRDESGHKFQELLPVKFCTMADHRDRIIEEVLIPKREEFRENLSRIHSKEEYGLRVRWKDLDQVFREIGEQDEKIREKKERLSRMSEEKRRNELIDVGHLVQEAASTKNKQMAKMLMGTLSPLASETKENNVLGDAMILNAAFLVSHEKQLAFDQAVNSLEDQYGASLQLKYVGPVPPFNFIEIVIKWRENPPLTRPPTPSTMLRTG